MFSIVSCTPNLPDIPITDVIPAVEGEERDRWAGPALPLDVGLNRLRWDLRTDSGGDVPRHDPLGRAHDVARGAAGDVVRLTVDGRVAEAQVEVRRNPWMADVTCENWWIAPVYDCAKRQRSVVSMVTVFSLSREFPTVFAQDRLDPHGAR